MYIPKAIFSNRNTNICLFRAMKETALTVIVNIINGWLQGHARPQIIKKHENNTYGFPLM